MTIAQDYEIRRLKAELAELQTKLVLNAFALELAKNLVLLVATKPWKDWTSAEKLAFEHAAKAMPTSAREYLDRLPKERL